MSELLSNLGLSDLVTSERMLGLGRAVLILVVGILVARVASGIAARALQRRVSAQEAMLVRRLSYYVLLALVVTSALHQLGFKLGVLLGAARVFLALERECLRPQVAFVGNEQREIWNRDFELLDV